MKLAKTVEFLSYLRSLGVKFSAEGGKLRCNASPGILTSTLRQEIAERKTEILAFLDQTSQANDSEQSLIQPLSRSENLLLSYSQQMMWFWHQLLPDNPLYNMLGESTTRRSAQRNSIRAKPERNHQATRKPTHLFPLCRRKTHASNFDRCQHQSVNSRITIITRTNNSTQTTS